MCQIVLNSSSGSLWSKWDLHVHTPASIVQDYGGDNDETWEKFFTDIESLPDEFKVIGINDYIFIDGYKKVIQAHQNGRMQNIALFLPVIELRLDKFGQSGSKLSCVNYHVVFSNRVKTEDIQEQFLNRLRANYTLPAQYEVTATKNSLELFGQEMYNTTPDDKKEKISNKTRLEIGFNNFHLSIETISNALKSLCFESKYLTAVGKAEWEDIRFGESGQGAAEKRTVVNNVDFVFTAAITIEAAHKSKKSLVDQQIGTPLFDCSDAHCFSDDPRKEKNNRIGNCFTWLKADLTFEGLKLAIQRYSDRVCISNEPDKLVCVRNNKTKYIKSIEVRRSIEASLDEKWFDFKLDFNHDLVAIIGNKGNGKSALTDIIALCSNTQVGSFSFLNSDRFCNRQKKAESFEAKLTWESNISITKKLSDKVACHDKELVRYVPQSFFEKVTNEVAVHEGSDFDKELKKVIFSHIPESDRLGFENLGELLGHHATVVQRSLNVLREQLHAINLKIFRLEIETSEKSVQQATTQTQIKKQELEAHDASKPQPIEKPEEQSIQAEQLEMRRAEMEKLRQQIHEERVKLTILKKRHSILQQVLPSITELIENVQRSLQTNAERLKQENIDIDLKQVIKIQSDFTPLIEHRDRISSEIERLNQELGLQNPNSLVNKFKIEEEEASRLQTALNSADGLYQDYLNNKKEWEVGREEIIGSLEAVDSLTYLEEKLRRQRENLPRKLSELKNQRQEFVRSIYKQLDKLKKNYENLAHPVQTSISQHYLTHKRYGLDFKVNLIYTSFVEQFLEFINQGRAGSFMGKECGREVLLSICRRYDFHLENNIVDFTEEILNHLKQDCRCNPPTQVEISAQLKGTVEIPKIYDFLFGLEYIKPEYSLQLDGKEMKQLSPGERGVLLLIFYLLIDKEDCPLLIDQPEENLDNQSVYNLLVPAIKEAKKRRQIFLVTHNPNLAIVCDAEQIIHASMDKNDGNRVDYQSGAIENLMFNKLALDILEGTQPAFDVRRDTYVLHS